MTKYVFLRYLLILLVHTLKFVLLYYSYMPWSVGTVHINCVIKFSISSSSRGKFQSIESVIVKEINFSVLE